MLSTHEPLAVVVDLVTAVSTAPERLEDRVDALVDILVPETHAAIGLLIRADVTHLDVQVIGSGLGPGAHSGMSQQIRTQLQDPLLAPVVAGDLSPTTAERAFGASVWRTSSQRASAMVAFGIDQVATLPVHGGADLVTFMVGRAGQDFTDEELALLRAVQPVVTGLGMLLRLGRPTEDLLGAGLPRSTPQGLTGREVEVLQLLAHGYKAAVIARMAGCSPRTIHRHLGHIYDKLGVSDRLSAVNRAHLLGVIENDLIDLP